MSVAPYTSQNVVPFVNLPRHLIIYIYINILPNQMKIMIIRWNELQFWEHSMGQQSICVFHIHIRKETAKKMGTGMRRQRLSGNFLQNIHVNFVLYSACTSREIF